MQINHFLLLQKLKNTESAQLWIAAGYFLLLKNYQLNIGTKIPFQH